MNIVIYAPSTDIYSSILNRDLGELNPELGVEIHRSLGSLKQRLSQPVNELVAAILYVSGEDDLSQLLRMQDLLWDLPLILVIPAQDRQTVSCAHSLRPRFLTDVEGDFKEVAEVLKRMLDKKGHRTSLSFDARRPEEPGLSIQGRASGSGEYAFCRNAATRRKS